MAVQRLAGNRATAAQVQRIFGKSTKNRKKVESDVEGGVGGTSSALNSTSAAFIGLTATNDAHVYQQNSSLTSTAGMGIAGNSAAGVTSAASFGLAAKQVHGGRKQLAEAKKQGAEDAAMGHNAKRGIKAGASTLITSTGSMGTSATSIAQGAGTVAQNLNTGATIASTGAMVGAVGGVIALPLSVLTTGLMGRKLLKQYKRFRSLRAKLEDAQKTSPSDAKKALQTAEEAKNAADALATAAEQERLDAEADLLMDLTDEHYQVWLAKSSTAAAAQQVQAEAKAEYDRALQLKTDVEAYLRDKADRARTGTESPEDIRAYAVGKQRAGSIKKLVNTIGGVLGVGGAAASMVAGLIGAGVTLAASATLATPFGWGLAAAAALVALGVGVYQFVKWAMKRYEALKEQDAQHVRNGGDATAAWRLKLRAMLPWVKVDRSSHRNHMAERLVELAVSGTDEEKRKAAEVISDLGLDWKKLNGNDLLVNEAKQGGQRPHFDETVNLVAAKMGS